MSVPQERRQNTIAVAMSLSAAVATELASRFVAHRFPDRPVAPDISYAILPHIPWASYVTLAAIALVIVVSAVYVMRDEPELIPSHVTAISLMYLLRAAMTTLTPLAHARDGSAIPFPLFGNGLFPSGHTALALLLILLIGRRLHPRLRTAAVVLLGVMMVSMLYSRGHYSIDLAGGALLGYFVWREWTDGRLLEPLRRLVAPGASPATSAERSL